MNSQLKGFREFLLKQNAVALAIGVIIGAAMGRVVSGLVDDVLMPILGVVLPGGEWRNAQVGLSGANAIKYGDLIGRLLDFVIVAAVVYALAKAFIKEAPAPATRSCPECLETIPIGARKCRACGSPVTG
ncbi:MAG: large conductance mechanosensitive channel protein MscL [Deltaproteobacteria bacterium]|nr:MAG: large conductance mechanosensitive channel protein MscL [Deltaproteobacteria bacterium]